MLNFILAHISNRIQSRRQNQQKFSSLSQPARYSRTTCHCHEATTTAPLSSPLCVISLQSGIITAVNNISRGFRCETHAHAVGSRDRLRQKDELRDQTTCIFETNEACRFTPSRNCRPSGHCGNNGANNSNSRHNGIGQLGNGVIETEVIRMVPGSTAQQLCRYTSCI